MSVPHVDTRVLDGKQVLLFGPFATFSTKFLKQGSLLDMFSAMNSSNLLPMMQVGLKSFDLVKYLVDQVLQSDDDRMEALRTYVPQAKQEDWKLVTAGQRVQIIKNDEKEGGVLRLGTEVVTSADGSISALLGASPGASTAAPIMLELMANSVPGADALARVANQNPRGNPVVGPQAERRRGADREGAGRNQSRATAGLRTGHHAGSRERRRP